MYVWQNLLIVKFYLLRKRLQTIECSLNQQNVKIGMSSIGKRFFWLLSLKKLTSVALKFNRQNPFSNSGFYHELNGIGFRMSEDGRRKSEDGRKCETGDPL